MKSQVMAAVIAVTAMIGAPCFTSSASAQPMNPNSSGGYFVPVVVGAAAGATVGALIWPGFVPAAATTAATTAVAVVPAASTWGWGAFYTTRAMVGAIIGGAMGFVAAR